MAVKAIETDKNHSEKVCVCPCEREREGRKEVGSGERERGRKKKRYLSFQILEVEQCRKESYSEIEQPVN